VITGAFMGFGAYFNNSPSSATVSANNVARVNDTDITQEEYLSELQNMAPQTDSLSRSQILPFKLNVLNSIIERNLILQKADEQGIKADVTDKDIDDTINQILENNNMTEEELKEHFTEQNYSYNDFKKNLRNNLEQNSIIQQTVENTYNNVVVSEEEIKTEYEKKYSDSEEKPEFSEAKDDIKNALLQSKQSKTFNNWLENTLAESDIEIYIPALNALNKFKKEDYEGAIESFNKAMENSESPAYYIYLAESYQGLENNDKSSEVYKNGIESFPEDWELRYNYGVLLQKLEEKEEAISQLNEASSLANENIMAHYQIYVAYKGLKAEEKAEEELKKINNIQEKMSQKMQQIEEEEMAESKEEKQVKE